MSSFFNYFTLASSRKSCWLKLYINFDYCCVLQQAIVEKLYTYQMLGYKRIVMFLTIKQRDLCVTYVTGELRVKGPIGICIKIHLNSMISILGLLFEGLAILTAGLFASFVGFRFLLSADSPSDKVVIGY